VKQVKKIEIQEEPIYSAEIQHEKPKVNKEGEYTLSRHSKMIGYKHKKEKKYGKK
jgi:hypothetical protein